MDMRFLKEEICDFRGEKAEITIYENGNWDFESTVFTISYKKEIDVYEFKVRDTSKKRAEKVSGSFFKYIQKKVDEILKNT